MSTTNHFEYFGAIKFQCYSLESYWQYLLIIQLSYSPKTILKGNPAFLFRPYICHFSFLQVKAVIDAYPGNLVAAEAAFEELVDVEDRAPSSTRSSNTVRKDKRAKEEDILQSLQNKVRQSGELLKCLNQPQPMNERTAFANYVRDSLLTMSKPKFRKARSAINNVLTKAMEDDTEYEEELPTPSDVLHNMPPPVRQVSASAVLSPSQSEMYQPPPHMWRHKPPQASMWASASPEYVEQYMQQPLQPQQQPPQQQPSQQQEQNILSPQTSMGYLSAVLGPASQVLNQSPNISDL